jgi:hypothetical protein
VPLTARYGGVQLLDLGDIRINDGTLTARDDDGLHVVGYRGDASGDGRYTTLDVQRVRRFLDRADGGFSAYPTVDPALVADARLDGRTDRRDLRDLTRIAKRRSVPTLPKIPKRLPPLRFQGPDPKVWVDAERDVRPGQTLSVPVRLDTAAGLEAVTLVLDYDAEALAVLDVRRGDLTRDFAWSLDHRRPGRIEVDMSRYERLEAGSGELLWLDLEVKPAARGRLALDLREVRLNDGRLTLNPEPRPGLDAGDGTLAVQAAPRLDFGRRWSGTEAAGWGLLGGGGSRQAVGQRSWQPDFLAETAASDPPNAGIRIDLAGNGP